MNHPWPYHSVSSWPYVVNSSENAYTISDLTGILQLCPKVAELEAKHERT